MTVSIVRPCRTLWIREDKKHLSEVKNWVKLRKINRGIPLPRQTDIKVQTEKLELKKNLTGMRMKNEICSRPRCWFLHRVLPSLLTLPKKWVNCHCIHAIWPCYTCDWLWKKITKPLQLRSCSNMIFIYLWFFFYEMCCRIVPSGFLKIIHPHWP